MDNKSSFNVKDERNLTMLVDFYELTMGNGYFRKGLKDKIAYFDMFFRRIPDDGGYCIMAGVEQLIDYLSTLKFTDDDITYLRDKHAFSEEFLDYLRDFDFSCDVWAVPEGNPVFPNEPLVTVRGPVIQAQFLETMILLTINHQTLIATKANRICRAADGRPVMEFGSRRAQGYDGAIYGARAAIIGGCSSTACTMSDRMFNIPAVGTMAHSWVQLYDTEYDAFKAWAEIYPDDCVLLIDTYNVIKSGIPNAIKVFDEVLKPLGKRPRGVRIDSGDITYLTTKCRKMLDEAGYEDCGIVVSNSLDEHIIKDVLDQGACINSFGVGERLITAKSEPVFGGVYKLVALEGDNEIIPKIKISENEEKITNPGFKKIIRIFDKNSHKAIADLITLRDENINENEPLIIFDPIHTWKRKKIKNYYTKELQAQIFKSGKCVYKSPTVLEIKDFSKLETDKLWPEVLRFENPHTYYVDLSQNLWSLKHSLLHKYTNSYEAQE
ncbi:nicotinate phosphoribosyltransferase [Clostridium beijerinckii]|uniref:Nicotinate phosphoribosyltransferase n=1 Tax=Clostridium beijerinckii TaxID=1520 RepID=A0AAX0B3E8_CLOBE|nr:nicotinate phosphoribosyltransferase [Clostridium beijerinckii]MZK49458.1 nicotinate phosphoribosyltransferase [Clostridium beijerinckii]MZK57549.1 nicotinate phosphoribosyltransferase [Clostridium beijerinckii]MZK67760.1 nicotinate phosphoribosyltransferase [Clostridium beijerinckii]MZK73127.1 nicotinate phosphoribosyltransferase [Clostridium beijerinckii]MZK82840.1 nicotinate phosphoribosyltransferase [Clostridium beijerinckii]